MSEPTIEIHAITGDALRTPWLWECDYLPDWTEDEYVEQHSSPRWEVWGVFLNDELVACFSAERLPDGAMDVHVSSQQGRLHFGLLKMLANRCANALLNQGNVSRLVTHTPEHNRPALWIARAAGFKETERADGVITSVRERI